MSRRLTGALGLVLAAALVLPIPAFAGTADADPGESAASSFDTPAPTQKPATKPDPDTKPTPKPKKTPRPTEAPVVAFVAPAPGRSSLNVGYSGSGVLAQAPLLVAQEAGYFDEAGLTEVAITRSGDVLEDVLSGDLDIGVVDTAEAFAAFEADATLHAIAGYRNYGGAKGAYGGDLLLASPRLVADDPATALAFLGAYIRALQLLDDAGKNADAYDLIDETDLAFKYDQEEWADALSVYKPFDGGFGSLRDEDGLGQLVRYLAKTTDSQLDIETFIDEHTLNIAQTWQELPANPASDLVGPPGVAEITVGMVAPEGGLSPVTAALEAGYFSDAGFTSVEVVDVEQPLLGVLQGKVDFGIMDTLETTEANEQGLPLAALAGHRNYRANGVYGGDMLTASADLIEEEGSTVSAFLIAYIRGLRDLAEEPTFASHDGGFGDRTQAGGLGELGAYLRAPFGLDVDLARLLDARPLEYAQAWWGLPANPTEPNPAAEEGE